jgi:hypothetical protein
MMTEITHDGSKLRKILSLADDLSSATSEARGLRESKTGTVRERSGRVIELINNCSIVVFTAQHPDL